MVSSFYFILGIVSMISTSGLSSMILVDFSKCTIFDLRLHITDPGYPIGHFRVNHLLVNDFFIQVGNTAEFHTLRMGWIDHQKLVTNDPLGTLILETFCIESLWKSCGIFTVRYKLWQYVLLFLGMFTWKMYSRFKSMNSPFWFLSSSRKSEKNENQRKMRYVSHATFPKVVFQLPLDLLASIMKYMHIFRW